MEIELDEFLFESGIDKELKLKPVGSGAKEVIDLEGMKGELKRLRI